MILQSLPLLPKLMILNISKNEIPRDSFFFNIEEGAFIALYSPLEAAELFYLCQVLSCEIPTESISDAHDHSILKSMKYVKVNYLEKIKNKNGLIYYKLLTEKEILVLPKQIFYPGVPVSAKLTLNTKDYQFLSDCI